MDARNKDGLVDTDFFGLSLIDFERESDFFTLGSTRFEIDSEFLLKTRFTFTWMPDFS